MMRWVQDMVFPENLPVRQLRTSFKEDLGKEGDQPEKMTLCLRHNGHGPPPMKSFMNGRTAGKGGPKP